MAIGIGRRQFIVCARRRCCRLAARRACATAGDAGDGIFQNTTAGASTLQVAAFRQGLNEMGFEEGRNLAVEYQYADNNYDRLSELAADLVPPR